MCRNKRSPGKCVRNTGRAMDAQSGRRRNWMPGRDGGKTGGTEGKSDANDPVWTSGPNGIPGIHTLSVVGPLVGER